jgi:hypothetical protein
MIGLTKDNARELHMRISQAGFVLLLIGSVNAHAQAQADHGEAAALLYEPYIACVTERAYYYSSGPDSASDIAVAAMQACEKLEDQAYTRTLIPNTEAELNIPTADRIRAVVHEASRKAAISVAVRNRAK